MLSRMRVQLFFQDLHGENISEANIRAIL